MRRLAIVASAAASLTPAPALAQAPSPAETAATLDVLWVMVAFVLVLFMQAGFAMLEVGFSRMKNVGSVVAKILANMGAGFLIFWALGFGLAFGAGNALFGTEGFFLTGDMAAVSDPLPPSMLFLFQAAFALVSLAIVWGTMLERTKFPVYLIFAVVFVGLIYPLVAHWVWSDAGWLGGLGKQDFAGSTVVHLSGAMAALAGTLILGPRLGKYDEHGRPQTIPGHNMPLAVLGVLILWLGWQGFNPGSTLAAGPEIADIALTTNLAAGAGVLGAIAMSYLYRRTIDVGMAGNGAIAALVAITAACAFVAPWAAVVIGFIAGVIMYASLVFFDSIGVDDPVGAIAAHGMGGIWGTLSCGLFTTPELAESVGAGGPGLFYGGGFTQLGVQAVGILAAGGFVFLASLAVFAALKATIGIRVKPEQELNGLDISEHGVYGLAESLVATDHPTNGNHRSPSPISHPAGDTA
ncbi:ammonium transporter [Rubrobacter taiwanensis]|uniref:Ammonium transporter n=1 Tax=Rubrobacter taiwanensis TaxID=185139 RepID=A0A4R1B9T0_9ACTN|nr:ammonium transporter [Rubrobacter taiwanensis]TCJ13685.1 ammonium transporter [Rubrobacter taiwanensis]